MFKISVEIDIKKDARNWWNACNRISYGVNWKSRINKRLQNKIVGKTRKQAFKFLIPYLKKLYKRINIEKEKEFAQNFFDQNKGKLFKRMQEVTGRRIYRHNFTFFLTTFPRAPYNEKAGYVWLPVGWKARHINVFLHELLHFQTLFYYEKQILERLGREEKEHLKEALTVILNVEFKDLLAEKDMGYRIHQYLRAELLKFWRKNRNFRKLISYGVKIYPKYADTIKYLQFGKYSRGCLVYILNKVRKIKIKKQNKEYIEKVIRIIRSEFNPKKHKTYFTNNFRKSRFISVKDIFKKRQATCGSLATVVATLLRISGIPVKLIDGYYKKEGASKQHAWNEIYFPDYKKFLPMDITRMNYKITDNHIKRKECVDWSELDNPKWDVVEKYKRLK